MRRRKTNQASLISCRSGQWHAGRAVIVVIVISRLATGAIYGHIPLCRLPRDVRDKPVTSPLAQILLRLLPQNFPVRGSLSRTSRGSQHSGIWTIRCTHVHRRYNIFSFCSKFTLYNRPSTMLGAVHSDMLLMLFSSFFLFSRT